jgi:hypothetical protein
MSRAADDRRKLDTPGAQVAAGHTYRRLADGVRARLVALTKQWVALVVTEGTFEGARYELRKEAFAREWVLA